MGVPLQLSAGLSRGYNHMPPLLLSQLTGPVDIDQKTAIRTLVMELWLLPWLQTTAGQSGLLSRESVEIEEMVVAVW